jgi:hypothetical protein
MADDKRKRTTPRQPAKSSEPLTEDGRRIFKLKGVGPEIAEMWKAHRFEKIQRSKDAPAIPERQTQKRGWQLDRINEVLQTLYPPHGRPPSNLTIKAVHRLIEREFEKKGRKPPGPDSVARALGRRDKRG